MAARRGFIDAFQPPYEASRPSYFVITGAGQYPVYMPDIVGDEQTGYHIRYVLVRIVLGVEDPHAPAQNNEAVLQTRMTPPNRPFPIQFDVTGWLPGNQLRLANSLPVYWPIVVGNGFAAYFVAYSFVGFVPPRHVNPFPSTEPPPVQQPSGAHFMHASGRVLLDILINRILLPRNLS